MSKLVHGKKKQVKFDSKEEKQEAMEYILTSPNVNFKVHENNQNQGAWGSEDRIHLKREDGVPESLKRLRLPENKVFMVELIVKSFVKKSVK